MTSIAILFFIFYDKIKKEDCSKEKKADIKCLETSRFRTAYIDLAAILLSEKWAQENSNKEWEIACLSPDECRRESIPLPASRAWNSLKRRTQIQNHDSYFYAQLSNSNLPLLRY